MMTNQSRPYSVALRCACDIWTPDTESPHRRLLEYTEVGRHSCVCEDAQSGVATRTIHPPFKTTLSRDSVFDTTHCVGGQPGHFHVRDLVDTNASFFESSPVYEASDTWALLLKRLSHDGKSLGTRVVLEYRQREAVHGRRRAHFRFFVVTDRLYSNLLEDGLCMFLFGKSYCRASFGASETEDMLATAGPESVATATDVTASSLQSLGMKTQPYAFQLDAIGAMSSMEDPCSGWGLGAVQDSTIQTYIYPRDTASPLYFDPFAMKFCAERRPATAVGGVLALGSGLGKSLIVIAHALLSRKRDMLNVSKAPLSYCSAGTVIVAERYLHTHWLQQIHQHAPTATTGSPSHAKRPLPSNYVDFLIVDTEALLNICSLKINRIVYDQADVTVRTCSALPAAAAIWTVTTNPLPAANNTREHSVFDALCTPEVVPSCAKYFPSGFRSLRKMIIAGGCGDQFLPSTEVVAVRVPLGLEDVAEVEDLRRSRIVDLGDRCVVGAVVNAIRDCGTYVQPPTTSPSSNGIPAYEDIPVAGPGSLYGTDDPCSICLSALQQPVVLGCKHVFCHTCVANDHRRLCPLCRAPRIADLIRAVVAVDGKAAPSKCSWTFTTALDAVLDTVLQHRKRADAHKTMVYCDAHLVGPLTTKLRDVGLNSLWLLSRMSTELCADVVRSFKLDVNVSVLIVDGQHLHEGFDIPCADSVVIAFNKSPPTDSAIVSQAVKRVRRLGGSKTCRVSVLCFPSKPQLRKLLLCA